MRPVVMEGSRLRILLFVIGFHQTRGYAPSVREIAAGVGLRSVNTAWKHLQHLRAGGWVTWEDGQSRTLRPLVVEVPLTTASANPG